MDVSLYSPGVGHVKLSGLSVQTQCFERSNIQVQIKRNILDASLPVKSVSFRALNLQ